MKRKEHKGFTLLELMVVVVIICVLAGIAYPLYTRSIAKSRVVEAVNLLEMLKTRQTQYEAQSGEYFTVIPKDIRFTNKKQVDEGTATGDYEFVSSSGTYRKIGKGFKMSLSQGKDQNCAVVDYNRGGVSFQVASAYDRPEIGCTGTVCKSFASIFGINDVTAANAICNCADMAPSDGNGCPLDYSTCEYQSNCGSGEEECLTPQPTGTASCSLGADPSVCLCKIPKYVCSGGSWVESGEFNETSSTKPEDKQESCADGEGVSTIPYAGVCSGTGWTDVWGAAMECVCKDTKKEIYNVVSGGKTVQKCGTPCTTCEDPLVRTSNAYAEQDGGCCQGKCAVASCADSNEIRLENPDSEGKCCACKEGYERNASGKCVSVNCEENQCKDAEGNCIDINNTCEEGTVGAEKGEGECIFGMLKEVCFAKAEDSCPSQTEYKDKCVCSVGYCGEYCEHPFALSGVVDSKQLDNICEYYMGKGEPCSQKEDVEITTFADFNSKVTALAQTCTQKIQGSSTESLSGTWCVVDDPYAEVFSKPDEYGSNQRKKCMVYSYSGGCTCDGKVTWHKGQTPDHYEWDCQGGDQVTYDSCRSSAGTETACPFTGDASGGGCESYKEQQCMSWSGSGSSSNAKGKCYACSCHLASEGETIYWKETDPVLKCTFGISNVSWSRVGGSRCVEYSSEDSQHGPNDCYGLPLISQKSDTLVKSLLDSSSLKASCTVATDVARTDSVSVSACADQDNQCWIGMASASCVCAYQ